MTNLTVIRNNTKIASLNTTKMEHALQFAKKDTDTFFFRLSVIADTQQDLRVKNKAWKFLNQQDKLQAILSDLITRLNDLKIDFNNLNTSEKFKHLTQLDLEISIFNEMHFRVKRTYLSFTMEHFKMGLAQSFMVA